MAPDSIPGAGRITPAHLRRCLNYLADRNYTFISIEQLVLALINKQPFPARAVAFSIDDGYADQAEIAAPIFLEFDCPLTFFVITGMLDETLWPWDAQVAWIFETSPKPSLQAQVTGQALSIELKDKHNTRLARREIQDAIRKMDAELVPNAVRQHARDAGTALPANAPPSYRPMTWGMARQLEDKGIQFAPHSVSHNILCRLGQASLDNEIRHSWQTLRKELTNPLKVFCYPSGRAIDFGSREITALRRNGFLGALSTTPGFVEPGNNPDDQLFHLPRFALPESMDDFIQYCTWIEYAKRKNPFRPGSKDSS